MELGDLVAGRKDLVKEPGGDGDHCDDGDHCGDGGHYVDHCDHCGGDDGDHCDNWTF